MISGMLMLAQEVVTELPVVETPAWWQGLVIALVTALIAYTVSVVNKWKVKQEAEALLARQAGRMNLRQELEAVLARIVSNLAQRERMELEVDAEDGHITKEELQEQLHALGDQALEDAVREFKILGIDLLEQLGSDTVSSVIRNLVDEKNEE